MTETISDTNSTYLRRDGLQAEWAWVALINTGMVDPPKVVTNPSTNRARRSVTSLMWRTPLPLRQTSHQYWSGTIRIVYCSGANIGQHDVIRALFGRWRWQRHRRWPSHDSSQHGQSSTLPQGQGQFQRSRSNEDRLEVKVRAKVKSLCMTALIVAAFIVCWTPYQVS